MLSNDAVRYADKVVEYHQFKEELGLTIAEAKEHEDTLGVFAEITDIVQASPDLVVAYTGVLTARGKKRAEATETVREIETDIATMMYDSGVYSSDKHYKEEVSLKDDAVIKQRAEVFAKLFKSVIPNEQLPKRRKPKKSARPNKTEVSHIDQDSEFNVVMDEDETIFVNGKKPQFVEAQDTIFRVLLKGVASGGDGLAPSDIKHTPEWKRYLGDDELSSHRLFSTGMRSLREMLEGIGLGNMIEQTGKGRGTAYRMKLDSYVSEIEAVEEQAVLPVESPAASPRIRFYEAQTMAIEQAGEMPQTAERSYREQLADARFASSVVRGIASLEEEEGSHGIKQSRLVKQLCEVLEMQPETAVHMLRQFRDSGDLFISAKKKGSRYISTKPPVETEAQSARRASESANLEHERIQKLREQHGTSILRYLSTLRGDQTEFRTAIANAVDGLEPEDVNAVCSLLKAEGLLLAKEEKGRGSGRARKGKTWGITSAGRDVVYQADGNNRRDTSYARFIGRSFRR